MKKSVFSFATLVLFSTFILPGCCKEEPDDLQYARVSRIVVTEFPPTKPDGSAWDSNGTVADLFVRLWDEPNNNGSNPPILLYEADYIPSSSPFEAHTFTLGSEEVYLLPINRYSLSFHDSDNQSQTVFEDIGSLDLEIQDLNREGEQVNPIVLSGNGISVEVYVEYIF